MRKPTVHAGAHPGPRTPVYVVSAYGGRPVCGTTVVVWTWQPDAVMARRDGERAAGYVLVVILAVELSAWGAFMVPLRAGGVPIPLGPAIAVVSNFVLVQAGVRLWGGWPGGAIIFGVWLLLSAEFGSTRHGSLILSNGPMSYVYLLGGTVSGAAALAARRRPASAGVSER